MAILKKRLHKLNSAGSYDTLFLESSADIIRMASGDSVESAINGKASISHKHSATDITSGILPVSRGGTGVSDISELLSSSGGLEFTKIGQCTNTLTNESVSWIKNGLYQIGDIGVDTSSIDYDIIIQSLTLTNFLFISTYTSSPQLRLTAPNVILNISPIAINNGYYRFQISGTVRYRIIGTRSYSGKSTDTANGVDYHTYVFGDPNGTSSGAFQSRGLSILYLRDTSTTGYAGTLSGSFEYSLYGAKFNI